MDDVPGARTLGIAPRRARPRTGKNTRSIARRREGLARVTIVHPGLDFHQAGIPELEHVAWIMDIQVRYCSTKIMDQVLFQHSKVF